MNDLQVIQSKIYEVNGQKVMLDFELAQLYGIETKSLKRAVRRNIRRFPSDFMFELSNADLRDLRCNFGTSSWGGSRYGAFAFTELGVAMLSSILNTDTAIDINIRIMRAFVELRRLTTVVSNSYAELKNEIRDVKDYIEDILRYQNEVNEDTRAQLDAISTALVELQSERRSNGHKPHRPIGFIASQD